VLPVGLRRGLQEWDGDKGRHWGREARRDGLRLWDGRSKVCFLKMRTGYVRVLTGLGTL
jgi:hypothetical protein